jgi:hypothetical protein
MKTKMSLPTVANTALVFLMTTANAFAASTSKVFVSKLGIMLFLGFCALVLVVQLIPAMITLYGMLKGIGKEQEKSPSRAKTH